MNINQTFELPYGDEYPKPIFARYNLNRIEVKRTRKRAIERARRKTRSKMIEVGDTVEVIKSSFLCGFNNGSRVYVVDKEKTGAVLLSEDLKQKNEWSMVTRWHRVEDVILIKKGSN